jgi:hypothetical protein
MIRCLAFRVTCCAAAVFEFAWFFVASTMPAVDYEKIYAYQIKQTVRKKVRRHVTRSV